MSTKLFVGSFFFKQTSNGNLIGEFSNNDAPNIMTESADFIKKSDADKDDTLVGKDFLGEYGCSWRQGNPVFRLRLNIRRIQDLKFELIWTNNKGDIEYSGQGFIVDDLLAGFYVKGSIP